MAIYRPAVRRWPLVTVVACVSLIAGATVGFFLSSQDSPNSIGVIRDVDLSLGQASAALEVVEVEYRESVEKTGVTRSREYGGAQRALASSRRHYYLARPALRVIDPSVTTDINARYLRLQRLMVSRAPFSEVSGETTALARILNEAIAGVKS